jgi:hypothetical protein
MTELRFTFPHKGSAWIDSTILVRVTWNTTLHGFLRLRCVRVLEPDCSAEKPDFQQGQQQTDVLEALLLKNRVGPNLRHVQTCACKCSTTSVKRDPVLNGIFLWTLEFTVKEDVKLPIIKGNNCGYGSGNKNFNRNVLSMKLCSELVLEFVWEGAYLPQMERITCADYFNGLSYVHCSASSKVK